MAWAQRDYPEPQYQDNMGYHQDNSRINRYTRYPPAPNTPSSSRYPTGEHSNPGSRYYPGPSTPSGSRYNPTTPTSGRKDRGHSVDRFSNRSRGTKGRHGGGGRQPGSRSQPSPPSTDGTTEETTETDSQPPEREHDQRSDYNGPDQRSDYNGPDQRSDYNGPAMAGYPVMVGYPMYPPSMPVMPMMPGPGTGSIRSVQSVPMLSPPSHTWDGEPCPVHHHHQQMVPLAALYGMGGGIGYPPMTYGQSSVPPSLISGATTVRRARSVAEMSIGGRPYNTPHSTGHDMDDRKSFHASMASLGGPSMILSPSRLGGRVVMNEAGAHSNLPQRRRKVSPLPGKEEDEKGGLNCCSGHFVVLWIILGIITFGVLLGIVLKFTVS